MDTLKRVLREQKWFLLGLAVLLWVVFVNRFPAGHIIVGGDVLQPINLKEQLASFHYGWFSGRVSIFYSLFYVLDRLGVTDTGQLSWYLSVFVFGAYLSFTMFARQVFPRTPKWLTAVMALFYATNVYTLYVFTATWGFTNYQILYVFIPALTGSFIQALRSRKPGDSFPFFLIVSLASTSFGNPAFAVSLTIYFFLLTVLLFIFRIVTFDWDVAKRIAILIVGALLLNIYWILPLIPQARAGVDELSNSTVIVLSDTLAKTSNTIFDTMRLLTTYEHDTYYPYNFPFMSVAWARYIIEFLSFAPFFLVLSGLFIWKSGERKLLYFAFFTLFMVFIALVARVRFPFDSFNVFFFKLPGINALRGWDKLAIFTPFILSSLLLGFFSELFGKTWFRTAFAVFISVALLLSLPFYTGGIQTKMSYILATSKGKDFATAKYSALVKLPEPYYSVANILGSDPVENKVAMLPYSPGTSVGRVNLPKLQMNGPDPANALYTKKYVELNGAYFGNWSFADEFSEKAYDPQWITDLYGLLGVKYVFYHHDAKPSALESFEPARQYLEGKGILRPIKENEWFTLYDIDSQYVFPYVYAGPDVVTIDQNVAGLSTKIRDLHTHITALPYDRSGTMEINVPASGLGTDSFVYLNEKYDPLWHAEYVSPDGRRSLLERQDDVRYANAWKVGSVDPAGSIDIYSVPIRFLLVGEWLSGITFLGVIAGAVWVSKRKANG